MRAGCIAQRVFRIPADSGTNVVARARHGSNPARKGLSEKTVLGAPRFSPYQPAPPLHFFLPLHASVCYQT
jgi:hypothetical protein